MSPCCFSRVSNAKALEATGQRPLTRQLHRQQLLLYGRVARLPDEHPMRMATFCPGGLRPAVDRYVRRVGRPRQAWASAVGKLALRTTGGLRQLNETILDIPAWGNVADIVLNQ